MRWWNLETRVAQTPTNNEPAKPGSQAGRAKSGAYDMHKFMRKPFILFLALLWSLPTVAEDQVLAGLFPQQRLDGTIVISSLHNGKNFIHNDLRANQRFSTASTFKIMNTLIAIEEKAISEKDEVLKWDGHIYEIPDWNHDQTLESAFKVSCVWCFQELARLVGAEKYRSYLRKSAYGELRELQNGVQNFPGSWGKER